MVRRAAAGIVLGLLLAGCAGPVDREPTTGLPSPVSPTVSPSPLAPFESPQEVFERLRGGGVMCDGYTDIPPAQFDPEAIESGYCTMVDKIELNASIYRTAADAESSVQRIFHLPAQDSYGSFGVVGDRWSVMVAEHGRDVLTDVQRVLGGRIVSYEPVAIT